MRITVTLDPDVAANLKKLISTNKLTFKQAVNESLVRGLNEPEPKQKKKKTVK